MRVRVTPRGVALTLVAAVTAVMLAACNKHDGGRIVVPTSAPPRSTAPACPPPATPDPTATSIIINGVDSVKALAKMRGVLCESYSIVIVPTNQQADCTLYDGAVRAVGGNVTIIPQYCHGENYIAVAAVTASTDAMGALPPVVVWYTLGNIASTSLPTKPDKNGAVGALYANPNQEACAGGWLAAKTMPGFNDSLRKAMGQYLAVNSDAAEAGWANTGALNEQKRQPITSCLKAK